MPQPTTQLPALSKRPTSRFSPYSQGHALARASLIVHHWRRLSGVRMQQTGIAVIASGGSMHHPQEAV
jgi:hypothetical protein